LTHAFYKCTEYCAQLAEEEKQKKINRKQWVRKRIWKTLEFTIFPTFIGQAVGGFLFFWQLNVIVFLAFWHGKARKKG